MTSSFSQKVEALCRIQKWSLYTLKKMEAYDHGEVIITEAWQDVPVKGIQYISSSL